MPSKEDRDLVAALCEIDHGLTDWEVNFVEDIARQVLDRKQGLTPKQLQIALRIQEKKGKR